MSLLRKVRVLVGALVHKPFMPRPERADLDETPDTPQTGVAGRDGAALGVGDPEVADTERVADLIARQQQEGSKDS